MMRDDAYLLTVNAGSSSVKFALFGANNLTNEVLQASIENIGQDPSRMIINGVVSPVDAPTHSVATSLLADAVSKEVSTKHIAAVGHRIVHGGSKYYKPQLVTPQLLKDLRELTAFDPEHLPAQLSLIETLSRQLVGVPQVVCFDTAFHHDLPAPARLLPIPRHFADEGIRKYGFHGLSYEFIVTELRRVEGDIAAGGKVIIAHLGSGASLVALKDGKSVDTTMGMTPASGIPMSTRSGDLDPGLVLYLQRNHGYTPDKFNHMVNFESGLLGVSETSADMKRLLEIENSDARAKEAIELFCYQVKKSIGALAASIGGISTLVFTGGMGENAPRIRAKICEGLEFLGVILDPEQNEEGARLISAPASQAGVHVIHTNEAVTIARQTSEIVSSK
jgi:acetate kinase